MASISTCKSQTSALVDMLFAARVSSAELETHAVAPYLSVSQMSTRNKNGSENRPLWYSGRDICWHTVRTINKYCLFAVGQKGRYKSSQFPRYVHALQVFSLSQGNRLCQKPGKGLCKLHPHFAHFPGVL